MEKMVATTLDVRRLVFVDECGTHTSLAPLYAWAPCGRRAYAKVARNRGKNTALLVSISVEGMGPCVVVEGTTTAEVFEAYVEQVLAPMLKEGQYIVMDNLSAHKGKKVRQLVKARGCRLLFLPPYSPDLNPIEEAFSKVKASLRRARARSRETLVGAIGRAICAGTAREPAPSSRCRFPASRRSRTRCSRASTAEPGSRRRSSELSRRAPVPQPSS